MIDKIMWTGVGLVGLVIAWICVMLFIVLPVMLHTEQQCLTRGFPKARVTWNLERYCLGYDGVVHPVVEKLP